MAEVVCIGLASIDIIGFARHPIVTGVKNTDFKVRSSSGGIVRNIAENLARLLGPGHVELLACVGDDPQGQMLLRDCRAAGLGCEQVQVTQALPTSVFMGITSPDGEMYFGAADGEITSYITPEYLNRHRQLLHQAQVLLICPTLPAATLDYIRQNYGDKPIFLDIGAPALAEPTAACLDMLHTLKANQQEAQALTGETDLDRIADQVLARGVQNLCVTLGPGGSYWASQDGRTRYSPPPLSHAVSATGAGDAFTAGLLYSFLQGLSSRATLEFSTACANLALQSEETVNPALSLSAVQAVLKQ